MFLTQFAKRRPLLTLLLALSLISEQVQCLTETVSCCKAAHYALCRID